MISGAALSLDDLALGFALGTLRVPVVVAVTFRGAASIVMSMIGLELDGKMGTATGDRGEVVGVQLQQAPGVACRSRTTLIRTFQAGSAGQPGRDSVTASQLGQLGARRLDPDPLRAEVDDQGAVILDFHDPAKPVLVVSDLVLRGELLWRRSGRRGGEGACGQVAPGRGAGRFHHHPLCAKAVHHAFMAWPSAPQLVAGAVNE